MKGLSLHLRGFKSWQLVCFAATCLACCSCRTMGRREDIPLPPDEVRIEHKSAVDATKNIPIERLPQADLPLPQHVIVPWSPPGIGGPWPHDEYLLDGGDRDVQVNINGANQLQGLELEDTVALYDTIDGRTCIEPSNKVCLYAPRFSAVRQVTSVVQNEQREQLTLAAKPIRASLHQDDQLVTTAVQPIRPLGEISRKRASVEQETEGVLPAISRQPISAIQGGFSPHEDFKAIRLGIYEESERARLLSAIDAAITWSHDKAVQVVLEGQNAIDITGDQRAQATFRIDTPNNPCLKVCKVASTKIAKPGDIVEFTIRFDNQGDTALNNIVLVDNLTTRLEYVPGTA